MEAERRHSAESVKALAARLVAIAAIFVLAVLIEVRSGASYSDREVTALYALVLAGFLLSLAYARWLLTADFLAGIWSNSQAMAA